jgi:hypothetical protein
MGGERRRSEISSVHGHPQLQRSPPITRSGLPAFPQLETHLEMLPMYAPILKMLSDRPRVPTMRESGR